ncbi:MAG: aminopeptidase P family protein [Acidimicrobiaceae bacterium]|nr:aminopeptidase P family protein [Acidimicrobiaceae bacterium]MYE76602.1 aminopeptidase P family protein [Acidimicrobiaceae bacterium]MYE95965.1 aminopeptidase P family protein [Acidimicrobiaceae bacterium]MYH42230.1 aminopeptidase P family protein [Acidimicrobiaceae bacterium]MYI55350.1 aminopeptidase P family protein [Acidimicrobiaceae bacterium]
MSSQAGSAGSPVPTTAPSLPPLRVDGRLDRLRDRLAASEVDAAVISEPANVRWLTGFTGSNGTVVLLGSGEALLVTDGRYAEQAPAQIAAAGVADEVEVVVARKAAEAAAGRLDKVSRLGLEDSVAWAEQIRWSEAVDASTVPLTDAVERLRAVKDPAELARIQAAARIADEALAAAEPMLRPGVTEAEIQQALDDAIRAAGASGPAYDTIVASGPNSALPHARPTGRELQAGDLVVVDVGAEVDGYRSDMTRSFVLGDPDEQAAAVLEVVGRSQSAGVEAVRPGVEASEIDGACRSVIDEAGMGEAFVHGSGHGVGLDIHELPRVGSGSTAVLEPGNVLTVEPGVYFPGVGGARVEDLLVVTADGRRPLTLHPKAPVVPLAR